MPGLRGRRAAFGGRALAAGAVLAVLAAAGCGAEDGDEGGEGAVEGEVVERMAGHLRAQGRESSAEVLEAEETTLARLPAPYLQDWEIYQVDNTGAGHGVQYYIGTSEQQSLFLRANPEAFAQLLQADGVEVAEEGTAEVVARDYLTATRPTDQHSYVVDSVEDIDLLSDAEDQRPELEQEFGEVIAAPAAEETGSREFQVTAYVIYGDLLEERTLTFRADGTIGDETQTLAEELPTPVSL